MSRDPRLRLQDIVEYAGRAISHTDGLTFAEFAANVQARDAVVYALLVIGEASKHVPTSVQALAPEVDWSGPARFRDRAAHGYDTLRLGDVWHIVREVLPRHRDQVAALLAAMDAEDPPPV